MELLGTMRPIVESSKKEVAIAHYKLRYCLPTCSIGDCKRSGKMFCIPTVSGDDQLSRSNDQSSCN